MAALREGLLAARARHAFTGDVIGTDLPVDEIFWDLAWSFEGEAQAGVYSFSKVHGLRFIQEFALYRKSADFPRASEELANGRIIGFFTSATNANNLATKDLRLAVLPLPSRTGTADVLATGWCLCKQPCTTEVEKAMLGLVSSPVQSRLSRAGYAPVLEAIRPPPNIARALSLTHLHSSPHLGQYGDEVVMEAILDACQGGLSPEEALRRAAARLQEAEGTNSAPRAFVEGAQK